VTGIIAYAVVVKHMVAHPNESLPYADRWLLLAALVMLLGGCLHIQWEVTRRLAPECFVAVGVMTAWLLIGESIPGWAAVAGIAAILAAMQSITSRKFRIAELPEADVVR